MSISRLPSSSSYRLPPRSSIAPAETKYADAPASGQQPNIDELMKLLQELIKALTQDGFDPSQKKGAGGGGGGIPGGGGGGGGGVPQVGGPSALGEGGPTDLGFDSPPGQQGPSFNGSANADAVAQQIAQDATSWNYDNSPGKSFDDAVGNENSFDGSKSGICTDMALEAAQRFEAAGIDARVVGGETNKGNHAWVEYKDENGQWKRFDPTAAACTKDASQAINTDNNVYNYGNIIATYDDVPAEVPSI
ncbi:transglutaminase-like domain-containing protein [Cystobacter ferrugineus]|uniref:Transglutaminase-like domain-containing protein n=1 Tax=Cystobacter ferrugineus TaxID=83449 RepID=A0A1L9BJ24_9BACT|nr:transglutaminase-like domain-containing protein [Cystobacter ferrugineus]OJH42239.1 hypothetical protein BON30_03240 [Cystobacter ferrugineus]